MSLAGARKILREIKPGFVAGQFALVSGPPKLRETEFAVATRKANQELQHFHNSRQRVHEIVVDPQTQVSVCETGIHFDRSEEQRAHFLPRARRGKVAIS